VFRRGKGRLLAGLKHLVASDAAQQHEQRTNEPLWEVSAMRQPWTWIAVALTLTGAILLVTDVGAAGLWIAVITIGIALVAIEAYRNRQGHHHA
jgi:hypothetical protein